MKEIDWSKAPEGAMCYVHEWGFFKCEHGEWWVSQGAEWQRTPYNSPENFSWFGGAVWRRKEWNGTGLPPAGEKCEYYAKTEGRWIPVVMIGMFRGQPVLGCEETSVTGLLDRDEYELRPRRTPEQIAAEERERAIDGMFNEANERAFMSRRELCAALYDAGYRKTEAKQ